MAERETAKNIGRQRIDAGLIKDNVWPEAESSRKNFIETAKISSVFNSIRQGNIKAALFLSKREIAFAVDGECKDVRIVLKNLCCAVALMHIKINDGSPADEAALSQKLDSDSNVIEHTEACAFRPE